MKPKKMDTKPTIIDAYKELGAEFGIKGYDYNGDPIEGFLPCQYDFMYQSDVTGAKIRFYCFVEEKRVSAQSIYGNKFDLAQAVSDADIIHKRQLRYNEKAKSFLEIEEVIEAAKEYGTLKKGNKTYGSIEPNVNIVVLTLSGEPCERLFSDYYFNIMRDELEGNQLSYSERKALDCFDIENF